MVDNIAIRFPILWNDIEWEKRLHVSHAVANCFVFFFPCFLLCHFGCCFGCCLGIATPDASACRAPETSELA